MREAGDVKNPLCGDNGATYVYGPQNGASEEVLNTLERGMRNYRDVLTEGFGSDEGTNISIYLWKTLLFRGKIAIIQCTVSYKEGWCLYA